MTFAEWTGAIASLTVVLAFVGAVSAWIFKKYADQVVNSLVKEYLSELKPNGGGSMRDDIKAIKGEVVTMKIDVARLEGRFVQHLSEVDSEVW